MGDYEKEKNTDEVDKYQPRGRRPSPTENLDKYQGGGGRPRKSPTEELGG